MGFISDIGNAIFGGGNAPDAPDYSPLADVNKEVAQMMIDFYQKGLDWAKEKEAFNQDVLNKVLAVQLPAMQEQFKNYQEDRARWESTFRPVETQLVEEAMNYDTPERQQAEMARAGADVTQAFEAQRQNALRNLEGYGIDPSQTRSQALDRGVRIAEATAQAQARNTARLQVENTGRALRENVANIGRGYPGQYSTSAGQAVGAGNAAMANANQTSANTMAMRNASLGAIPMANTAMSNWNTNLNTGFQNALGSWGGNFAQNQANIGNFGSVVGLGLGMYAEGGEVNGPGGPKEDAIPAKLSKGEYVIPAHVVRAKGTEFFDKMVQKYEPMDSEPGVVPDSGNHISSYPYYQDGGMPTDEEFRQNAVMANTTEPMRPAIPPPNLPAAAEAQGRVNPQDYMTRLEERLKVAEAALARPEPIIRTQEFYDPMALYDRYGAGAGAEPLGAFAMGRKFRGRMA